MTRLTLVTVSVALWSTSLLATPFQDFEAGAVIGDVQFIIARHQDTLLELAKEFDLGYEELVAANPKIDSWLPGEGNRVVLPKSLIVPQDAAKGIYINLAEYRLYYFPEKKETGMLTFPISIGRGDWVTPVGMTRVVNKVVKPAWYPPKSIREEYEADGNPLPAIVPPGPDNPLGDHALKLDLPGYLIHGTNKPYGIGMKLTHGCIRLHPKDMALLFERTPIDTSVKIVWEPFKVGVRDGVVYLEAHSLWSEVEATLGIHKVGMETKKEHASALTATIRETLRLVDGLNAQIDQGVINIDWLKLAEIVRRGDGIPYPISAWMSGEEIQQKQPQFVEASREAPQTKASSVDENSAAYLF